jgi:hypothetical protein
MSIPAEGDVKLLKYLAAGVAEGDSFLRDCDGYPLIQHCVDQIVSKSQQAIVSGFERPEGLATTTINRFKKVHLEFVSGMTDIRPFWDIRTYNTRFQQQADIFSKLSEWWYTNTNADQEGLAHAIRWASVAGSGYVHLHFDPTADRGMGEITATGRIDPRDVIPFRPYSFSSIQCAEGVFIREEKTINYVKDCYPEFEDYIVADRYKEIGDQLSETRYGRLQAELNAKVGSLKDYLFGDKPKTGIGRQPVVDLYTAYFNDSSVNDSGNEVEVGDWEDDPTWTRPDGILGFFEKPTRRACNNWSYKVKPGEPLYPRGRRIVFTRNLILSDGPNPYWHGLFPIIKLTLDAFPTTFLGLAPMWDLLSLQASLDWNLRVIDDHNAQVAQPPVIGDALTVGPNGIDAVNTRKAGLKLITNPMGKGFDFPQVPPLDTGIYNYVESLKNEMDVLAGTDILKQISALNQAPSADTIERLMQTQSGIMRSRSRSIEAFMREFATQLMWNFCQFYTAQKKFTIMGPRGNTPEDFDFDPGNMVPAFVHGDDFNEHGDLTMKALMRGPMPVYNRATEVLRHMAYYVMPGSLLESSASERKMIGLQMLREGALDLWTFGDLWGVPWYGEPPAGCNDVPSRLAAQASMGIMMGGPPGGGRPPSGQAPPQFANNGGGQGSAIRESR